MAVTGLLQVPGRAELRTAGGEEAGQSGLADQARAAPCLQPPGHLRRGLQTPHEWTPPQLCHRAALLDTLVSAGLVCLLSPSCLWGCVLYDLGGPTPGSARGGPMLLHLHL